MESLSAAAAAESAAAKSVSESVAMAQSSNRKEAIPSENLPGEDYVPEMDAENFSEEEQKAPLEQ